MTVRGFWKFAQADPERPTLVEPDGTRVSAGELLAGANQVVHGLRALGLGAGDCVAVALPNGAALIEAFLAAMQAGWYITPLNTHLTAGELAYILKDSDARAYITSNAAGPNCAEAAREAGVPESGRFAVGPTDGFVPYATLKQGQPTALPDDRQAGQLMQYTSGTTGRPKGVKRALARIDPDVMAGLYAEHLRHFDIEPGGDGVHLCGSPMYHLAALAYCWFALHFEHRVIVMDKWTPESALALIERHRVTNTHMVPTQFHRLLLLPDEVRRRYDTSSLRNVLHAAAPCPIELKRRMLEWWGPVIYEYYGASEGGGTLVKPQDWLEHPGTVGRPWPRAEVRILDDEGKDCAAGETGTVYMKLIEDFEYRGDLEKTRANRKGSFFTVGDIGYLDSEGYLYLCDRKIDMIISGGVNIYPAEVEAALLSHPQVGDAAVFGIPDPDWGEQVKAVVEPAPGISPSQELGDALLAHCTQKLAKYKCPRTIDFVERLPRDPNGKLYRRKLRDPYWSEAERRI